MKKPKAIDTSALLMDEETEWLSLTPAKRFLETTKLWKLYIAVSYTHLTLPTKRIV